MYHSLPKFLAPMNTPYSHNLFSKNVLTFKKQSSIFVWPEKLSISLIYIFHWLVFNDVSTLVGYVMPNPYIYIYIYHIIYIYIYIYIYMNCKQKVSR